MENSAIQSFVFKIGGGKPRTQQVKNSATEMGKRYRWPCPGNKPAWDKAIRLDADGATDGDDVSCRIGVGPFTWLHILARNRRLRSLDLRKKSGTVVYNNSKDIIKRIPGKSFSVLLQLFKWRSRVPELRRARAVRKREVLYRHQYECSKANCTE